MSAIIELQGDSGWVRIDVEGYENPASEVLSDANWLTCRVEVRVGAFQGCVDAAFTTYDFASFDAVLRRIVVELNGEARFETDEDALRLCVYVMESGRASVTGVLRDPGTPRTSLAFAIESDQSFLRATSAALADVVRCFPVRVIVP